MTKVQGKEVKFSKKNVMIKEKKTRLCIERKGEIGSDDIRYLGMKEFVSIGSWGKVGKGWLSMSEGLRTLLDFYSTVKNVTLFSGTK